MTYITKAEKDKQLEKRMTQMLGAFGNFLLKKRGVEPNVTQEDLNDFEKYLEKHLQAENELIKKMKIVN